MSGVGKLFLVSDVHIKIDTNLMTIFISSLNCLMEIGL